MTETLPNVITLSDKNKITIGLEGAPGFVKIQNNNQLVITPQTTDAGRDYPMKIVIKDGETGEDEHYSVTVKVPAIPPKISPAIPKEIKVKAE